MNKQKDSVLKTEHTANYVNNHKNKFDDYMYNEKDKLVTLVTDTKDKSRRVKTTELNLKTIEAERDTLFNKHHELFSILYGIIEKVNRDYLDIYFNEFIPYKVKKIRDLRSVLNVVMVTIKNPDYNKLNEYEAKIENSLNEIDEFLPKLVNAEDDKDKAVIEYEKAFSKWEIQYKRLKSYYKGWFEGKDDNYKDYFLDLGNKKKSKSKDEDNSKDEKVTKDDTLESTDKDKNELKDDTAPKDPEE